MSGNIFVLHQNVTQMEMEWLYKLNVHGNINRITFYLFLNQLYLYFRFWKAKYKHEEFYISLLY